MDRRRKDLMDRTMEAFCWRVACETGDTTQNNGAHHVDGRRAWDQLGAGERGRATRIGSCQAGDGCNKVLTDAALASTLPV